MLCVAKQTIAVALEDHEVELLRVTAAAAGRSAPEYARDALLGVLYALNKRLAQ